MPEHVKKYSKDELIVEAECLEKCGEYIHADLVGYTPDELRYFAAIAY